MASPEYIGKPDRSSVKLNTTIRHIAVYLSILAIAFLTRTPIFLGSELLADGDECLLGLMATHKTKGLTDELYFYGQDYGLSVFETAMVQASFHVFGTSDKTLKMPMLFIWSTSIFVLYLAFYRLRWKRKRIPELLTLFLLLAPCWALFSLKARNGFQGAFLLASISFLAITSGRSKWRFVGLGLLIPLIYECQSMWVLPLIVVSLLYMIRDKAWLQSMITALVAVVAHSLLKTLRSTEHIMWHKPRLDFNHDLLERLFNIPRYVFEHFTGSFHYEFHYAPSPPAFVFALIATILVFGVLPFTIFQISKKEVRVLDPLPIWSMGTLICVLQILIPEHHTGRYLIPLLAFAIIPVAITISSLLQVKYSRWITGAVLFTGFMSVISLGWFNPQNENGKDVVALIDHLKGKGIEGVYCSSGLFQYQLAFYSNEEIIARSKAEYERYRPYLVYVDSLREIDRSKIAYISHLEKPKYMDELEIEVVGDKYYLCYAISDEDLNRLGFSIKD